MFEKSTQRAYNWHLSEPQKQTAAAMYRTGMSLGQILPVSRGGQTTLANLQLLCNPCHRRKSGAELRKEVS